MKRVKKIDVLVAGAGPVGLFTALQLAERGLNVRIVDQEHRTSSHSYALVLHPATLRTLFRSGPFRSILRRGAAITGMSMYEGADRKTRLPFPDDDAGTPFALVLPQSVLEGLLEEELARWDVEVDWTHRLVSMKPGADAVDVEVARLDRAAGGYPYARMEWIVDKTFRFQADYVVGADGYNSFVRRTLGIPYRDLGAPQCFSVYEFDADAHLDPDVRVALNAETTEVLWPLAEDRFRFSFQTEDTTRHQGTEEELLAFAKERTPWFDGKVHGIRWTTSVLFERRLADTFGKGRVWLAGDAAHITGPVGGQSMNVGLLEGAALAQAIGEALGSTGSSDAVEAYGKEFHGMWEGLLGIHGAPDAGPNCDPWVAERAARILPCLPASGEDLDALLKALDLELGVAKV
jgi:2-polyprenyl-6-methoxyphenol hydroxylase-like FAD-dependent oxidoreductase